MVVRHDRWVCEVCTAPFANEGRAREHEAACKATFRNPDRISAQPGDHLMRVEFRIEAVPKPKRGKKHGGWPTSPPSGEGLWPCGNSHCGACAASIIGSRCDFRAPTGERCRFLENHLPPMWGAPPEVAMHVCIAEAM
jgi:hypothetical protein